MQSILSGFRVTPRPAAKVQEEIAAEKAAALRALREAWPAGERWKDVDLEDLQASHGP